MKELQKKINVKIKENNYDINFPTNAQFIEIENKKIALANGMYSNLVTSGMINSNRALDLIDVISYFSVLIPGLNKDLRVNNLLELNPVDTIQMVKVFKKEFFPWYKEWLDILKQYDEDEEEEPIENNDANE